MPRHTFGATCALVLALLPSAPARAQTCQQLRDEIANLTRTLQNEQRALANCTAHPGTCTPGQIRDFQEAIRTAQQELAADQALLPTTCAPATPPSPSSFFTIRDVSPDQAFGDTASPGTEPTGRIMTVVVDPKNPSVLYAASEYAGIWKSSDGARSWVQSSRGLKTGESGSTPTLAVDELNPKRLAFASGNGDYRPGNPSGGIWVSVDGAATWRQARFSSCPSPKAFRVAFAGGHGYAVTSCGLAVSAAPDLLSWTLLPAPSFGAGTGTLIAARGQRLFACGGTTVQMGSWPVRPGPLAGFRWTATATLPGNCLALSAATSGTADPLVLAMHGLGQAVDVSTVVFRAAGPAVSSLGFPTRKPDLDNETRRGQFCCGAAAVFAAARKGDLRVRQDVFASDGFGFYQYLPRTSDLPQRWHTISGLHADTWSMAFPSTYDPIHGSCTAYAASDGGIRMSLAAGSGRACFTGTGPWGAAQSGLHAFAGTSVVGVSQAACGQPSHNCPALYLSGSDNATWVSTSGGVPGTSWRPMPCCGDTGSGAIDWASPGQVVLNRNGFRQLFQSADGRPPGPSSPNRNLAQDRPDLVERGEPPQQATFAQVATLTAEAGARPLPSAVANGDYVQVSQPAGGDDTVVRTVDANTWTDIAPARHLPADTISALAASGGHANPTVYVLTADGAVRKRTVEPASADWQDASGAATDPLRLRSASDLWVNPYEPQQLYVIDSGAGAIKSSVDGGAHWRVETQLGQMATHDGEFSFGCFGGLGAGRRFCSLQQMIWVRDRPAIRIALLFPGGLALSRDSGATWRAIDHFASSGGLGITSLRELLAYPYSAYVDTSAGSDDFSLYVALKGRGLVRIDGRF